MQVSSIRGSSRFTPPFLSYTHMTGPNGGSLYRVPSWTIWRLPRRVILLVLIVDLAAVALPLAVPGTLSRVNIVIAGLLASLSIAYSVLTGTWELVRRAMWQAHQDGHYRNFLATWCFAAAVTLPPLLAAGMIVISTATEWLTRRKSEQPTPHRYVYSSASAILTACTAGACVKMLPFAEPWPVVAAAGCYLVVGVVPVVLAQLVVGQRQGFLQFLSWDAHRVEAVTVLIGIGEALLIQAHQQAWIWLSLPAAIVLQRWIIQSDLRAIDAPEARPMGEQAWAAIAREVIKACPVGAIMRIRTTDPMAASQLAKIKAGCDAIGMTGRSGLAILLTQCPSGNADALAERMRAILQTEDIVAQVAVAAKPRDGQTLDELLAVSEAELITRVAASRPAKSDLPEA